MRLMINAGTDISDLRATMKTDCQGLTLSSEEFIRTSSEKLQREGVILGLSGGVDSALVASLCVRAVGSKKVLALIMPEKDSEPRHISDARQVAEKLGIEAKVIDITPYLKKFGTYKLFPFRGIPLPRGVRGALTRRAYKYYEKKTGETPFSASIAGFKDRAFGSYLRRGNAFYRIKHRVRMLLLYLHAELENRLVVGAANKTEYLTGFFVKHGCDDAADIMPILGLYKTQVRELAEYLDVPLEIRRKPPSPDIIVGITDEQAIGIPYDKLDLVLAALERGWETGEIAGTLEMEEKMVCYVRGLTEKSEHMRKTYMPTS
jgi:NAD+ synthase